MGGILVFQRIAKHFLIFALILSIFPFYGQSFAEGPNDPAPEIQPKVVNDNAGKKVLFDNTHGQTAGAADWVIDGAFSDFANGLAEDGFYVKELRKATSINYEDLSSYDVFVVGEANIPYKKSEQDAMLEYVENGGSIFFIGDHYNADRNKNRWDASEIFNGYRRGAFEDPTKGMSDEEKNSSAMQGVTSSDWLGSNFGIRFRYNALGDVTANHIVSPDQAFGITQGVNTVAMHAGSTMVITDPKKSKGIVYLPETNEKWKYAVDQGVYAGGGIAEGPYAAISKLGKGKAAFIGDSSPVEDITPKYLREETGSSKKTYDGFKEQDDATLLVNMVDWLADQENYTSLDQVESLELDQATSLLDMENPAASTEPQAEPWSAPQEGYKWWDPTTFKAGSYGSDKAPEKEPTYSAVHQSVLPNKSEFTLRIVAEDLLPGTTTSGYDLGIYVSGGKQVAKVQNEDGSWPESYGYSNKFSLTADASGRATKDLKVQIEPTASGDASLRFRLNGGKRFTNTVAIGDVEVEPLPDDEKPVPDMITIAEARSKQDNEIVTIEGVITSTPGIFGSQAFYIQDETAGILIYQGEAGFALGDKVKISGVLTHYNNEQELKDLIKIEKTGTGSLPTAKQVTVIDESNFGQLVRLDQVTVEGIEQTGSSFEFNAVTENGTTRVRVDSRTGYTKEQFTESYPEGTKVNITGLSAIYRDIVQLKPRSSEDIQLANVDAVAPTSNIQVSGDALSTGEFLNKAVVELTASDDKSDIATIEYRLKGSDDWTRYESKFAVEKPGLYQIEYRATDRVGNVESVQVKEIVVTTASYEQLKKTIQNDTVNEKTQKYLLKQVSSIEKTEAQYQKFLEKGSSFKIKYYKMLFKQKISFVELSIKAIPNKKLSKETKQDIKKLLTLIEKK
ncbi:OmpL47-type beta-barrel domain-containing protein [Polycladospora coralii]|uniref:OmpL47-type beta-barrel domain-containing protein n=1 Tax=Polycladospora coralii TaxID=2771432 RepID=UPI003F72D292